MEITFRHYRDSDLPEISALFFNTVHTVCAKDYTKEQLSAWAPDFTPYYSWQKSFEGRTVILACCGEKILGFGDIAPNGYLDRFYIHRDFQGRGIGSKLLRRLESTVPDQDLTLYASITARPFFEKMGYSTEEENYVVRDGVTLKNYFMRKKR